MDLSEAAHPGPGSLWAPAGPRKGPGPSAGGAGAGPAALAPGAGAKQFRKESSLPPVQRRQKGQNFRRQSGSDMERGWKFFCYVIFAGIPIFSKWK